MSLLLDIFRCPNVRTCLESGDSDHPCSRIVQDQGSASFEDYQMPEPWMGKRSEALGEHRNGVGQPESGLAYFLKGHIGKSARPCSSVAPRPESGQAIPMDFAELDSWTGRQGKLHLHGNHYLPGEEWGGVPVILAEEIQR